MVSPDMPKRAIQDFLYILEKLLGFNVLKTKMTYYLCRQQSYYPL